MIVSPKLDRTLTPQNGVRLCFQRGEEATDRCDYVLDVYAPDGVLRYRLVCDASANTVTRDLEFRDPPELADPAPWVHKHMDAFAQKLLKPVRKGGAWPRKVLVWRER